MGDDVLGHFADKPGYCFERVEWGGVEKACHYRSESLLPVKNVLSRRLLNLCSLVLAPVGDNFGCPSNESRDKPKNSNSSAYCGHVYALSKN